MLPRHCFLVPRSLCSIPHTVDPKGEILLLIAESIVPSSTDNPVTELAFRLPLFQTHAAAHQTLRLVKYVSNISCSSCRRLLNTNLPYITFYSPMQWGSIKSRTTDILIHTVLFACEWQPTVITCIVRLVRGNHLMGTGMNCGHGTKPRSK